MQVLITLVVGIVVGYWLCRMQLRGKFILAEELTERVLAHANHLEQESSRLEQESSQLLPLLPLVLLLNERCPNGFSAKQVIGYNDFGYRHPAQYPGGIRAWDANVNGILHEER